MTKYGFLDGLFPKKQRPTFEQKYNAARKTIADTTELMRQNLNGVQANKAFLGDQLEAKAFNMKQVAGRGESLGSVLSTGKLPSYDKKLTSNLSDAQLEKLALNYRTGKLNYNNPQEITSALQNQGLIDPYEEMQSLAMADKLDTRGFDAAQERLRAHLGSKVSVTPNRKEILNELQRKSPQLATELEEMLGNRQYVFPKDIERIETLASKQGIPFDIREFPKTTREMELLGSNQYTTPFGRIQNAAGGKYSGTRQIVDATPDFAKSGINAAGKPVLNAKDNFNNFVSNMAKGQQEASYQATLYPEELGNISKQDLELMQRPALQGAEANKKSLMNILKQRMGERLPKGSDEQLLDSWLTNPREFERTGELLPEREFMLQRPVLEDLFGKERFSRASREQLGDALVDISKERYGGNLKSILQEAESNPSYLRARIKQIHPNSELNQMAPRDFKAAIGDIAKKSNTLTEDNLRIWNRLEPELSNSFHTASSGDGSFHSALSDNPEFLREFDHMPAGKAADEAAVRVKGLLGEDDALSAISSPKSVRSAESARGYPAREYPAWERLSQPSANSSFSFDSLDDMADAATFNKIHGNAPKINDISFGSAQEGNVALANRGAVAAGENRVVAQGAPAVAQGEGMLAKGLKVGGKVANAAMLLDAIKQGSALRHNFSNRIEEKGLIEGGWQGAKETASGVINYALDSGKALVDMGSSIDDKLRSTFGSKSWGPELEARRKEREAPGWWKQYLPESPLDRQRFQSNGMGDDFKNYFKELANDIDFTGKAVFQENGPQGYGNVPIAPQQGTPQQGANTGAVSLPAPIVGGLQSTGSPAILPSGGGSSLVPTTPLPNIQNSPGLGVAGDAINPAQASSTIKQNRMFSLYGKKTSDGLF